MERRINLIEVSALRTEDILQSFPMRQCAVALSVDRELQPVFQHEADTLHCARAYEIRFSTHVGADVNDSVLWDLPAFFDAGFVLAAATQ